MTKGSCQSTAESKVQPWLKPLRSARFIRLMTREAGGSVCRTSPKSMCSAPGSVSGQVLTGGAGGVDAVSRAPRELPLGDDGFAAREHALHASGDALALVRRVVDVHVVRLGGHDLLG